MVRLLLTIYCSAGFWRWPQATVNNIKDFLIRFVLHIIDTVLVLVIHSQTQLSPCMKNSLFWIHCMSQPWSHLYRTALGSIKILKTYICSEYILRKPSKWYGNQEWQFFFVALHTKDVKAVSTDVFNKYNDTEVIIYVFGISGQKMLDNIKPWSMTLSFQNKCCQCFIKPTLKCIRSEICVIKKNGNLMVLSTWGQLWMLASVLTQKLS